MVGTPLPADNAAKPFGQWERSLASRYLRTKRKNGGVALISIISFTGIALAVAALVIIMSVMNGFRSRICCQPHAGLQRAHVRPGSGHQRPPIATRMISRRVRADARA